MQKHRLALDDLEVETFAPASDDEAERGTVHGQSGVQTCATCVPFLCWVSRLQTNCCTRDPAGGCSLPQVC